MIGAEIQHAPDEKTITLADIHADQLTIEIDLVPMTASIAKDSRIFVLSAKPTLAELRAKSFATIVIKPEFKAVPITDTFSSEDISNFAVELQGFPRQTPVQMKVKLSSNACDIVPSGHMDQEEEKETKSSCVATPIGLLTL
jgi:hypothetical protein